MNMYESPFAPMSVLSEKIARHLFDALPENNLVFLIIDKNGNRWPSDSEAFDKLDIEEGFLNLILEKIDDGAEPVISQIGNHTVVAAELATERTPCGYIVVFMRQDTSVPINRDSAVASGPERTIANIDLLEIIVNQVNLIASLVEKNSLLYELQLRNQLDSLQAVQDGYGLN
ncbi:MAG: hypothetical protein JW804_01635 [Sedimentisphaerales bacterium]|nr:hypothetical protein [Sedimentisphaerales bacterium]